MKLISVVVPMYFEELVVEQLYTRLKNVLSSLNGYDHEIIFVNDGSKDKTLTLLLDISKVDEKCKIINFSRNFGHSMAVTAGVNNAIGDAVVLIDADLQDPPEVILDFIKEWEKGNEVVYGQRVKRNGETIFKKTSANLFYAILDNLSETNIPRNTGDFRLMDRKVVDVLNHMPESNRFVRGLVSWVGFKQVAVSYVRDERFAGETKYSLKKMLSFANDGITSFSNKPLKMAVYLGLFTLVLDFLFVIYIAFSIFQGDTISGWASIMLALAFFFGILFVILGIIGSYISRIYDEVKNRPLYIIESKTNFEQEKTAK